MIVVDASALIEALLSTSDAGRSIRQLMRADPDLHTPHLLDAEVTQVLRRLLFKAVLDEERALQAVRDLHDIRVTRHAATPLLPRVWAMRSNFSAYDATYVALAEALEARLLTQDERLAAAVRAFTRLELA